MLVNNRINDLQRPPSPTSERGLESEQRAEEVASRLPAGCFAYKSIGEHLFCLARHWIAAVGGFLASFGAMFLFFEASALFTGADVQRQWVYPAVLVVAAISGMISAVSKYLRAAPAGFEAYPSRIQRMSIVQRPLWEYRLALSLLEHDIVQLDAQISRLREGTEFVEATSMKVMQYNDWLRNRMENYLRLLATTKQLFVYRFPAAIVSTRADPATPERILSAVNALTTCYASLLAMERAGRAVLPPRAFERIHQIHLNWGLPIQGGFWQVCQWLEHMSTADPKGDVGMEFNFEYASPPGMDEFVQEYDELQKHHERWVDDL